MGRPRKERELKIVFNNPNSEEDTQKMLINFYAYLVYDAMKKEEAENIQKGA